jgi:enediyne biosynthesis protein E4
MNTPAHNVRFGAALAVLCLGSLAPVAQNADSLWPTFTDVTEPAGIRFKHSLGDFELSNIVEATAPGGLFFDYNNDGLLDIYFVNGRWHPDISDNRGRSLRGKLRNALYRNNGDGTFTDVTDQAGVGGREDSYGMAASCADFNQDGFLDLYVCNYGQNILYRNNGDGTFTDVTDQAGVTSPGWSVAAPWLDYNNDGLIDLFVVHYLQYDKGEFQRTGAYYKADNFPGPLSYPGLPDRLYRNNGDGTFTDVTREAGLWEPTGRGMGAVAVDIDLDGDLDIYVTNDAMPNNLWINDGKGRFQERAAESGTAFGEGGQGVSSMGPFVADVDQNGLLDLLIPDMRYGALLLQVQPGFFVDTSAQSGLAVLSGQYTGWGGLLNDYNNNGYPDLFIANGNPHHLHIEEAVIAAWDGKSRFIDMARQSGPFFEKKFVARGAAFADFDNDGDIDILVHILNDRPCLLRNDGGNRNHWLKVIPVHPKTQLPVLGATVTVTTQNRRIIQPVLGVNGYLTSSDPRPHFGLGNATQADRVEILWPGGKTQVLQNIHANQILTVPAPQDP